MPFSEWRFRQRVTLRLFKTVRGYADSARFDGRPDLSETVGACSWLSEFGSIFRILIRDALKSTDTRADLILFILFRRIVYFVQVQTGRRVVGFSFVSFSIVTR